MPPENEIVIPVPDPVDPANIHVEIHNPPPPESNTSDLSAMIRTAVQEANSPMTSRLDSIEAKLAVMEVQPEPIAEPEPDESAVLEIPIVPEAVPESSAPEPEKPTRHRWF